jgi:hypothetical protein
MKPCFITVCLLALLVGVFATQSDSLRANHASNSSILSARDDDVWWPLPEHDALIVICFDKKGTRNDCYFEFYPLTKAYDQTGIKNCYRIHKSAHDISGKMSIAPSADLKCTLFEDDTCRYATPQPDPAGVRVGKFPNVVHNFTYPGRGNFNDESWNIRGFYGDFKGKPPRSFLCAWKNKKEIGLGGDMDYSHPKTTSKR